MIILTIRTDKPEAEIGLFEDNQKLNYKTWIAHRSLSETIHQQIDGLLKSCSANWQDIKGVIFYVGPGSFTGLRIGAAVANTLADSLSIPIVGASGQKWLPDGVNKLIKSKNHGPVLPFYGTPPKITKPKK